MPTSEASPTSSSRSRGAAPAVSVSVVTCVPSPPSTARSAAVEHLLRIQPRQAAEIARLAMPLVTRPARQRSGIDRDRADAGVAPRHRSLGQRRAEQRHDRTSSSSRRRAAGRCRRRCTAPRAPPARAVPTGRTRRSAQSRRPRPAALPAPPPPTASAAPRSDGPEVMIMRLAGSSRASAAATRAKCSAGQRRNGLPALTCMSTIGASRVTPAASSRASTTAAAASIDGHFDRRLTVGAGAGNPERLQQIPLVLDRVPRRHQRRVHGSARRCRPRRATAPS